MKINLNTRIREAIPWYTLLAFVFSIPLSQFVSVRVLILSVACTLLFSWSAETRNRIFYTSWAIWIFLLVQVVGLLYSSDLDAGFRVLETSFSLLAVPIVMSALVRGDTKKTHQLYYAMAAGLVLACIVCVAHALRRFIDTGDPANFFYENLSGIIQIQPTYLAYYIIFVIAYGLYTIFYGESKLPGWVAFPALLFLFVVLLLSGGQTSLVSFILVLAFFSLKYLLEQRTREKSQVFVTVCVMILVLYGVNSLDDTASYLSSQTDYWDRLQLWKSAIAANPNVLFGVGTGDDKLVLNEYYLKHGMNSFAVDSYNAHNQFIQTYFTGGLVGVVALLLMLGHTLYVALRKSDTLAILTIFPFFIYGMTEVFLGRYQGVVFYAFAQQIVASRHLALSAHRPVVS